MKEKSRRHFKSMSEISEKDFKPLGWLLPNVIPSEGITLLVSPPKAGKSCLILNIICALALGLPVLGTEVMGKKNTAYLDFENSGRRTDFRVNKITGGVNTPKIDISLNHPRLGEQGGERDLRIYLENHNIDILVIDTLQYFQDDRGSRSQISYSQDVKDIGLIRNICKDYNITCIIIHHTRKKSSTDWVDMISGTHGLSGSADTLLYLDRDRNSPDGILHVTGRDVEEEDYNVRYDKATFRWVFLGADDLSHLSRERRDIIAYLRMVGEPIAPVDIANGMKKEHGAVRRLIANMEKDGDVVRESYGMYVDRTRR